MLSEQVLEKNVNGIQTLLKKIFRLQGPVPKAAERVNNYDWWKEIPFLNFKGIQASTLRSII